MSIVKNNVVVRHVSASDTSNVSSLDYGASRYEITFDQSIVNLGNVIMFEYKIQAINSNNNFDDITFGFISVENATVSGIANQFILSVPASENVLDDVATKTIQFRVYAGLKNTEIERVFISEWTNSLELYNPPVTPVLERAYFDPSGNYESGDDQSGNDDLFVFLDVCANAVDLSYSAIKFVVCYFYQDADNNTVWNISDPILSSQVFIGGEEKRMVVVKNIGQVTLNSPDNKVYVTAHAVYDWILDGSRSYALSYVSNEIIAISGSTDNKPDITDVCYNVYSYAGADPEFSDNQTIRVKWNAPGNSGIPYYNLDHYELWYSINDTSFNKYVDVSTNTLEVDVSLNDLNMVCRQNIKFRVNAKTILGDNQYSDDSAAVNFFRYSTKPTELVITNTSLESGKVGMTVNFKNPLEKGCGAGERFVVLINGQEYSGVGDLSYNPAIDASYAISYSNLIIDQVGDVKVYLRTQDTNIVPGGLKLGQSVTVPYIANILRLDSLNYRVYNQVSEQIMDLSWSNPALTGWSVDNYEVQKNGVIDASFASAENAYAYAVKLLEYQTLTNLDFQVIAHMQNTDGTKYDIYSNTKNLNTFTYALALDSKHLVITDTSLASGKVGMTVNFKGLSDIAKGLGDGFKYVVKIDGAEHDAKIISGSLAYDSEKLYSITYQDLSINPIGFVEVYLQTEDTNSSNVMDGASVTTPYIANNVVLSDILYHVYDNANNAEQNMDMSWNNPALGSGSNEWLVKEFQVELKKDSDDDWNKLTSSLFIDTFFTYNASGDLASVTNLQFRIKAVMKHTNTSLEYILTSNESSKKTFTYASAPESLSITDISYDPSNYTVSMTVNFPGLSDVAKGLGDGLQYVVKIDGAEHDVFSGSLAYDSEKQLYSIVYSGIDVSQNSTVEVYLQTKNTNSSEVMDGASITTPYIANIVTLDEVVYDVYAKGNNEQYMNLSWSNPSFSGWDVEYKVQKLNNNVFDNVQSGLSNTDYKYNATADASANLTKNMVFRVIATLTKDNVSYDIISNEVNKNTFKYADAPKNAIVHWAVANASLETMDVYVTFENPDFLGVNNNRVEYKVELLNASDEILDTKIKTFDSSSNHVYKVGFDNATYSVNGKVRISLYVTDTNSTDNITFYTSKPTFVSDMLPKFIDVSYDANIKTISGTIVSATPLKPFGQVIYPILTNGVLSEMYNKEISTNMTTTGMTITNNGGNGPNSEYIYTFVIEVENLLPVLTPPGLVILVANTVGVGKYIKKF